ncbi:MAG: ABC-F family ATP-binding cassette domain-containing protein, partial [Bacteroidales bacterium]|nr:ABC-F family ATP-binding cassette domain-containing protein [Bacteroidales bacterium]
DVLLLDEPTNHLDIESIQWLENFLSNYKGAVMLISHDRTFLDAVTTRTIEISLGKIYDYNVPYSKYIKIRQEIREHQLAAYKNQQKYIQDTKKFIERFRYKATKAVQVQSRIKQLEKLDIIEIDEEDTSAININFPPAPRSGSIVFELENISKSYNNNQVLNKIDLSVERNEKIAFIGKNGEGKTTLVKILINEIPFEGTYKKGHNLKIGYFAQNQDELLNENITVFDTIDNVAVGDIRSKIRTILGAFLFSGDDIDKKVKVLSGGERSRLALIKLLLEPYNLLILDEPTNHLDMRSKDILKHALLNFNGTLIVVSHDRDFIDGLVNKIYEFKNKKIKECTGNIYNLLKKQKGTLTIDNKEKPENHEDNKDIVSQKDIYLQNKEIDRDIKKAENQIHKCEKNIEIIEKELEILNEKLSNPETSGVNFEDYFKYEKYRELENKLKEEINEWEKLNITLEKHKAKKNN